MQEPHVDVDRYRRPDNPVEAMIYHRWSPRAMSGESLTDSELMRLFEAARWAPSSFNEQPWRFVYARRDAEHWPRFFELLSDGNRRWAGAAAVLIVVVSRTSFERNGNLSRTHSYDTGAAWQNLALQGSRMGLVVHGMAGFDYERARDVLRSSRGIRGGGHDRGGPAGAGGNPARAVAREGVAVGQEIGRGVRVSGRFQSRRSSRSISSP